MDKKELYEKAEKAFNQAFEATKVSIKVVSEKAGEAANITKLLIEKASLEHKVTKHFAQLGNRVYEKAVKDGGDMDLKDATIQDLIERTRKLDSELNQVEAKLEQERKGKAKEAPTAKPQS